MAVVCAAASTMPDVDRIFVRSAGTTPDAGEVQRARRAAALGVDEQLGVGLGLTRSLQVGAVDAGVHVALAHPDVHVLAASDALHVRAEELVGAEQDRPVLGDRLATTSTAFDDVQQMSVSAFTAAVVLT